MPIIRATVTVAEAAPKATGPTASVAAVLRGVTVTPNPRPKSARPAAIRPSVVDGSQLAIERQRGGARDEAADREQPEGDESDEPARGEGADRRREGEGAERDLLVGRAAV